jgi:hypothetical protein
LEELSAVRELWIADHKGNISKKHNILYHGVFSEL